MSGEKVPYHLRQNKYVDRQLFIDVLSHINRVRAIDHYLYVSFGGAYLEDFKIVHSNFGNQKMLSLETESWVFERQRFNLPYGCIDCENLSSGQFLERFDDFIVGYSAANILAWLDYARADLIRTQLNEFETLVQHCRAYDVIKLTLNANPATLGERVVRVPEETAEELRERRFQKLILKLGDYVPSGMTSDDVRQEKYAMLLLRCIKAAGFAGIRGSQGLVLQPLTAFTYQDAAHQMLTATSIILPEGEVQMFLSDSGLGKYEFRSLEWHTPIEINVPFLSVKEKFYLDALLFKHTCTRDRSRVKAGTNVKLRLAKDPADTLQIISQYLRFYRYYPHYHRIQY